MDFIDEQDGARSAVVEALLGSAQDDAELLHTTENRAERHELRLRAASDHLGQSGLSRAGWTPQDDRRQAIGSHRIPEHSPRREQALLSHHLLEALGAHAICQRTIAARAGAEESRLLSGCDLPPFHAELRGPKIAVPIRTIVAPAAIA